MDSTEPDISSHPQEGDFENKILVLSEVDIEKRQEVVDNELEPQSLKVPSSKHSQLAGNGEFECNSQNIFSVSKGPVEIDLEDCHDKRAVNKCEIETNGELDHCDPNIESVDVPGAGVSVKDEVDTYLIPQVGLEFESEDHAYKCYSRYAVLEGFSIRKDFVNKSRINGLVVSRRYTCYRQGYRPTRQNKNARNTQQETRTGCLAHMTIARQSNGKFRVTHFETKHNHDFVASSTANKLPTLKRLTFAQAVESELANKSDMDGVPKLGMAFGSEDHAYEFYNAYAGQVGFSVRKDYVNRSKIDGAVASRRFTCFREGFRQRDKREVKRPRRETRIGCLAQLVISRQPDGKYRATHFEEKHNHELVAACRIRMLRSQKGLSVAQAIEGSLVSGSMIETGSVSKLICNSIADTNSIRHDPIDYGSKLPSKCMREMKLGEAGRIQQFFESKQCKNPSFFYAMQLDAEDHITNVFWADTKMMEDYNDFGDVVCFDTTFRLHKDYRPFAPFVGVNHHKQMLIFGAAFLYDETIDSFKWVFRTFMEAMSGKKPKTILTHRDVVMTEAINSEMPETHHRLCVWHLYQNTLKQLSHVFLDSDSFTNDLGCCFFYHEEEEDFLSAWKLMLDVYDLRENEWLNEIYGLREKWAIAYGRHIFCAGIQSVLREGFTVSLKKYLNPDSDVVSLFKHIGKVANESHYKELEANYGMSQNMPRLIGDVVMLKHARDVYTPKMFEAFQEEYEMCLNFVINQFSESGSTIEYRVSMYEQIREYTVSFDTSNDTVWCSCMKFEFVGILCSHALKVLDYRNVKILPSLYVIKRWTRDARI